MLSFAGFWRVTRKYFGHGVRELRDSLWKRGYLEQVRKICPTVQLDDLEPWPAGIRAQAVLRDGSLVHDFLFADSPRSLHVCNAPSPAATSALPIGAYLCDEFARRIG
jgi:L-2-hydroxyglutarate oxidase